MVRETACASVMQNGVDVYNLGMSPTPVVFREARKYGAGIVVTSSHNQLEWNGLKFIVEGRGINEQELTTVLQDQSIPKSKIGKEIRITSNYIDEAVNLIGRVDGYPSVLEN